MPSDYEQDWRNQITWTNGLSSKLQTFYSWDSPSSATDINSRLPPAWSICVFPFHFVCELRKQIHQASPNFSWLLFPPNLWVMAHRQLMFCTGFSLRLWQFPLCLLVLNWSGLIWVFYGTLVSSEGSRNQDIDVYLCLYQCIWQGWASTQGLCRFVNYLTLFTCSLWARQDFGIQKFLSIIPYDCWLAYDIIITLGKKQG